MTRRKLSPEQVETLTGVFCLLHGLSPDVEIGSIRTLPKHGRTLELVPVSEPNFGTEPIGQFVIPGEEDEELPHTEETAEGRVWKFNPDCEAIDTTGLKLMEDPYEDLDPHIPCATMFPSCALLNDESNGHLEDFDPDDPLAEGIAWGMGLDMDPYQTCRRTRRFEGCDPDMHLLPAP